MKPIKFKCHGDEGNHACDGGRHVWLTGQISASGRVDWHLRAENRVHVSPSYNFFGKVFIRDADGNILASHNCGPINVGGNLFGVGRGECRGTFSVSADVVAKAKDAVAVAGGQDTLFKGFDLLKAIEKGAAVIAAL